MNRSATNRQGSMTGVPADGPSLDSRPFGARSSQTGSSDTETLCDISAKPDSSRLSAHRPNSEVWRLVLTDKLTGLCNQHGFIALADQHWRVSRRANRELVFVRLELGNLQEIQAGFERGESDLAVIALARILMKTFRRSDVLCRWDKGEFAVLAVDAEGLSEPMLRARIQLQVRKTGGQLSRFPLVLKGRIARINPRSLDSIEQILARLDRDFADFGRTWFGADAVRPVIILQDAPQK
jgi:diguanylate cyclase (GGDEF)-like protein